MKTKTDNLDIMFSSLDNTELNFQTKMQFTKKGEMAFDYLSYKLSDPKITENQLIHSLEILLNMRYIREPSLIIEKILDLTQDSRENIRSSACCMVISLFLQAESCGTPFFQLNHEDLTERLKKAYSMGLNKGSILFVNKFLEN